MSFLGDPGATVAGSSSGTSGDGLSELCMPTGAPKRGPCAGVWGVLGGSSQLVSS